MKYSIILRLIIKSQFLFQGIFQTLAAGGLPPAIAKYVAEYEALNEHDMARQTIYTSLKIMVFLGISLGVLMIFVFAPKIYSILVFKLS